MAHILHRAVGYVTGVAIFVLFGSHLLAIQGNCYRMRPGTGGLYQGNRFARCGTRAHHVINDQHPALQGRAYQRAAFAMVFGLFAVVGKRHIAAQPRQLDGHRRTQRNAFVRGAEQHIKLHAAG